MTGNISPLFRKVNKQAVLIVCAHKYKLNNMRYGERLRLARDTRKLTQTALSELSKVNQSLISQLENSKTATGSEYTVRLARELNISADWLADEVGDMISVVYETTDPKIIAVAKIMEPMPSYAKDAAVEDISKVAQLIAQARANGKS